MKRFRFLKSFSFRSIGLIVALLLILGVLFSAIGYASFTNSLTREYTDMGFRTASTAATIVDGNSIDNYLKLREGERVYDIAQRRMDVLCNEMDVTLIYVIKVDTTDYGSFVAVFNSVNKKDTHYKRWNAGFFRETTNEEYRQLYRDIYENGLKYGTMFRTKKLNGAEPHLTVLVPIKDRSGRVTAILCVQRPMNELLTGRRRYLQGVIAATVLFGLFIGLGAALYIRKHFVRPLRKVTLEAERFAKETSAPITPLSSSLSRISEISTLAESVNTMETDMLRYIGNLTAATAEKERIGTELDIARQIQATSIPSVFPAFPDRQEFDIYASMTPAKAVGGDFYDFFLMDDDHLALVIADVSGKGIPAALFMMVTMILIKERTMIGGTPGEILSFVNDRICNNNEADMFVTVWLGILEISTGRITAANAGHDDPALCRAGGDFEIVKNRHGPVIGAMPGIQYHSFEMELKKGDKLFLYTDGVPEATNADDRMFSIKEMLRVLNEGKDRSPQGILEHVWAQLNAFVNDAPQFDDVTMLCFEMKNGETNMQTLKVPATIQKLDEVMGFVDAYLEAHDCSMKTQMQIDLCVEEIFVNIANYAYSGRSGDAEIRISETDGVMTLTFIDEGVPYDPLKKADPDITLSAEERQIGGLGIFLVKKNMDTVNYRYANGKNVLTMTKKI